MSSILNSLKTVPEGLDSSTPPAASNSDKHGGSVAVDSPNKSEIPDLKSSPNGFPLPLHKIENREWWLLGFAVVVTLALTLGIVSFTFPWLHLQKEPSYWSDLSGWIRGLAALVLLFDIYTLYQQLQLHRIRRQLAERDQLFQLISENAADMIARLDSAGRPLYASPAYGKVLGYFPEELQTILSAEQIHPGDRQRVLEVVNKAHLTGQPQILEYRIRHKDQSWRYLESTVSAIRNSKGTTEKLVIVNRDITERKRAEDMLAHSAFHDALTDLPNRALFLDRLQHALTFSKRRPSYKFAVLLIDVDEFKVFNDSLGHAVGDELLVQIGQRLTRSLREADMVSRGGAPHESDSGTSNNSLARLGGDEFTVLLDDIQDPSDAIRVAERIQKALATPFTINSQEIVLSASIGMALSNSTRTQAEDLLRDADIAMYRAKRRGKACCEVFDSDMHTSAVKRLKLETDLRRALTRGEFRVYYQPVVSLQTGKITGFEALSRWCRPDGLVPPGEFIALADETGLIIPMNRALMLEACQQLRAWQSQFPSQPPLTMSVNVTPRQFAQPELAREIGAILEKSALDPGCLQLEILETIAMQEAETAANKLAQLKELGVRLSIDDFGTGYSSLSRLQKLPIDTLKIDRSFISNIDTDAETREIVRIIIMLAHNLGLKVVAEGTETREHVDSLKLLNCESAQGYFFAKPVDQKDILKLLATSHSREANVFAPL